MKTEETRNKTQQLINLMVRLLFLELQVSDANSGDAPDTHISVRSAQQD